MLGPRPPGVTSESESRRTTDHDEIRNWVEERGGHPARVEGTGDGDGLLRIGFGDEDEDEDEGLERIDWDEFFEAFEESDLALVYQDETDEGEESRFSRLVSRED